MPVDVAVVTRYNGHSPLCAVAGVVGAAAAAAVAEKARRVFLFRLLVFDCGCEGLSGPGGRRSRGGHGVIHRQLALERVHQHLLRRLAVWSAVDLGRAFEKKVLHVDHSNGQVR